MNVYCPAGITSALGGVENGEAKHMLAATVTANKTERDLLQSESHFEEQ